MNKAYLVSMGATPGIDGGAIFKWVGVPALTVGILVVWRRFRKGRKRKRGKK